MDMQTNNTQSDKKRFDKIINEIETELDMGTKFLVFGSLIKTGKISGQLQGLRKEVYQAIDEAQQILAYRDKVIKEAHLEADEIVQRRQIEISKQTVLEEAEQLAKSILIQAKKEAEKLYNQAKEETDIMRKEASDFQEQVKERSYKYANTIYNEIESKLNENSMRITRNREDLKKMLDAVEENSHVSEEEQIINSSKFQREERQYS